MKNLLLLLLLTFSLQAQSISEMWESSSAFSKYLKLRESGYRDEAMLIRYKKMHQLTQELLSEYIHEFKPKFQKRMLEKFYAFPLPIIDLTYIIHKSIQTQLKSKNQKEKNRVAKAIYDFVFHINNEDAKAQKYLSRLIEKHPALSSTKLYPTLQKIAKESDIEAVKTPQQRGKEYEEFIAEEHRKQAIEKQKQAIEKQKQENWDEIINKLKSL